MSLECKKCGKKNIENEAFNSSQGGFLCNACYRSTRLKYVGCSMIGAIIGLLLIVLIIGLSIGLNR